MKTLLNAAAVISMSLMIGFARAEPPTPERPHAISMQMVVTAEPHRGSEVPPIERRDVKVIQDKTNLAVTDWVALQGDNAGLELYVLIDEKTDPSMTARLEEIRRFISSQADTTAVGVAFMDDALGNIVQVPTKDHALAAKALRPPSGNMSASDNPFYSVSDLINRWPAGTPRREVLIVTDGIDRFGDIGGASMYLDLAIEDAQRAGVQVFCFYAPSGGPASHSPALMHGGQAYLAQLAEETGGEAYFEDGTPSPSFEPYLADMAKHLAHQYRVTFLAPLVAEEDTPVVRPAFEGVAVTTQLPNAEITSAHGFYVSTEEIEK
jgi:hypothetical protein